MGALAQFRLNIMAEPSEAQDVNQRAVALESHLGKWVEGHQNETYMGIPAALHALNILDSVSEAVTARECALANGRAVDQVEGRMPA